VLHKRDTEIYYCISTHHTYTVVIITITTKDHNTASKTHKDTNTAKRF